jgi:hypothetical protein
VSTIRNLNLNKKNDASKEYIKHDSLRLKIKKIEDSIFINNYIRFSSGFVNFGGWPISADLGVSLINDIEKNSYSGVLEFGSGLSTVIFNKALNKRGVPVLSIEHNENYYIKSKDLLTESGVSNEGLILAELSNIEINGGDYKFYDCFDQLIHWERSIPIGEGRRKLLLLIDGPPAKTCHLARYPSLIYASKVFIGWDIHVFLDDFNRVEEKEIAFNWKALFGSKIEYWFENKDYEKGLLNFILRN